MKNEGGPNFESGPEEEFIKAWRIKVINWEQQILIANFSEGLKNKLDRIIDIEFLAAYMMSPIREKRQLEIFVESCEKLMREAKYDNTEEKERVLKMIREDIRTIEETDRFVEEN